MIIHDISRDSLTTPVYKDDPETEVEFLKSMDNLDKYNLSYIKMTTHCGTHIDGASSSSTRRSSTRPSRCRSRSGSTTPTPFASDTPCFVARPDRAKIRSAASRLSHSAAIVLAESRVILVGTDADSIATPFDEARPHRELARAGITVIENLNLSAISDGEYELCAFPIKLGGLEAAPCRAILFEMEKGLN